MGNVRCLVVMALSTAVAVSGFAGEVMDLRQAVTAAGLSLSATATRLRDGSSSAKLVNGVVYAADDTGSQRVMWQTASEIENPSVTVTIPDEFEPGSRIVLREVWLYPVTYWNNAKNRMPTEYRVVGIDDGGCEYEFAHPAGLEYPGLGGNATNGEHYVTSCADGVAARIGFRQFKVEFLYSPSWAGEIPVSLMEVELKVEVLPANETMRDLYGVRNFSAMLRENGYPIKYNTSYAYLYGTNGWSKPANAFDGYTFHETAGGDVFRWMGYTKRDGGFFASIRAPEGFRPTDLFVPVGRKLWSLSYNNNEINRAPTEWRLSGTATPYDDAIWKAADETGTVAWSEIEHPTGKSWSGVSFNVRGRNTLGYSAFSGPAAGYRAFRFRPLASIATTASTKSDIDAGLAEIEIFVMPVNQKGTLSVRADRAGCDFGTGYPADGDLVTEECTVEAPEYVKDLSRLYRVTGYRIETFDYAARRWQAGEPVASRVYSYVPEEEVSARLVWELEVVGFRVYALLQDGGNERPVEYAPAYEGVPYYAPGTVLTLTARPNTNVLESAGGATNVYRSSFVRWEGDTNGLADVTSPVITFTVDGPRVLHPVYRRDWLVYLYDKANEGGSGTEWRMKDGNFDLAVVWTDNLEHGTLSSNAGAKWRVSGFGPLDLSTKIVHYTTGEEIVVKKLNLSQLGSKDALRADFTRIVLPPTLTNAVCAAFRDQTNLVEVVIDCPDLKSLGGSLFTRDTYLDRLVFKAPKLERISDNYLFFRARMNETDANDWDLRSLKTLTTGAESRFSLSENGSGFGFYGTLSLPRIETISNADFRNQQHMTNIVLGAAGGKLSQIGEHAFFSCVALVSATFGNTMNLTVASDAFDGCPNLKDIAFVTHVPPQAAMDAILINATETARANVYVSPRRSLWDGFLTEIDEASDPNPPAEAVGVYVTADGKRKAWIFYRLSPFDLRQGMILFVK